jgi:hypothetical protein
MPKLLRTLIICSLLVAGAVSPAVATAAPHPGTVSVQDVHDSGTDEEHTP